MKLQHYFAALGVAVILWPIASIAAPPPVIRESVAVCDPNAPSHCLAPSTGGGSPVAVTPTATTGTDAGGAITTGGTAQTAMAANASRKGGWIENPVSATEDLFVSFTGTAVSPAGTPDHCDLAPGGACPLMQGNTVVTSAISVIAVTTGHKFLAVQF